MSTADFVATIVAGRDKILSPYFVGEIAACIKKGDGQNIRIKEIEANKATDIFFRGNLRLQTANGIDVLVQPAATRRKKLLIADMESTIIEQEILDEMAELIGLRDKVAAITARGMNGELDFAASLRERTALFKGQPVSLLDKIAKRITFMPGAQSLITKMKSHGAQCWLVTGGFGYFVKPIAERLGFDRFFANDIVLRDGIITGDVAEPILDKNSKKLLLQKACDELGITLAESLAVGDGANDIPMLAACNAGGGLGVAYHAKPAVRAVVPHQINYGDLTALLYAQGLTSSSRT